MQVKSTKHVLKAPGSMLLKPRRDGTVSNFAFNFDLRRFNKVLKLEHNNMHGWFLRLSKKEETTVRKKLSATYQVLEAGACTRPLFSST